MKGYGLKLVKVGDKYITKEYIVKGKLHPVVIHIPEYATELGPLKEELIAELSSNIRKIPPEELRCMFNDLAEEHLKEGYKGTLSKKIAKETGLDIGTVRKYLKGKQPIDDEYVY